MRTRTFNAAVRLGKSVRIGRHALPTLALAAAQGAARSVVDEHDASDIYAAYSERPVSRSYRVQASKLRQVIRAANPKLVMRVWTMHNVHRKHEPRGVQLYETMVNACRLYLTTRRCTRDDIAELLSR